jgi:hypothetical protein
MNAHRRNHFHKVASDMNNYVAMSAYYYYQNQYSRSIRNQRDYLAMYPRPSLMNSGLGSLMAYGLYAIGMPENVVRFGYRFGYFLDSNA